MASLLILTKPINRIIPSLPKVLDAASSHVKEKLFVHLDYSSFSKSPKEFSSLWYKSRVISSIYSISSSLCPKVDVSVLMSGFKQLNTPINTKIKYEKIYFDHISKSSEFQYFKERYYKVPRSEDFLMLLNEKEQLAYIEKASSSPDNYVDKMYDNVVTAGTFDGLHSGHKILLSEAVLRCRKRLTVGIANGPFLTNKILKELILPYSRRIELVKRFLITIDPTLKYNLSEVIDNLGPTKYDRKMEMIVFSEETMHYVKNINGYRKKHGMNELKSHVIGVLEDSVKKFKDEKEKYSSSSYRMRLLGTRLKEVAINPYIPSTPYIIGLTGGSASGKTSIGKILKEMGAAVIDCDKLGHEAYEFNSECYHKIENKFGHSVLNEDKSINRKVLGSIVFENKEKLKQLTDIVWPEILSLAKAKIKAYKQQGRRLVILEAAVLLEANWDTICHEVWVSIIDREEAVRRIIERDGVTLEAAQNRVNSQLGNEEKVTKAHVVFSTLFSYEYTIQQVEKAWKILENEGKLNDLRTPMEVSN